MILLLFTQNTVNVGAGIRKADQIVQYAMTSQVKTVYSTLQSSSGVLQAANDTIKYLSKETVMKALSRVSPDLVKYLTKVVQISTVLGPAGKALGMGVDLIMKCGLNVQDCTVAELDEISRQIEELKDFKTLKVQLRIERALHRFLPIHDSIITKVQRFERILASRLSNNNDIDVFCERIGKMSIDYTPSQIIDDLHRLHVLITGEAGFGKPFFEQLAEEANELQGEEFNQFISSLSMQFQQVVGWEIRAVRMLRSFIAYHEEDVRFSEDVKSLFKNLAYQRQSCDPISNYHWYFKFLSSGGVVKMTPKRWPNWYVYFSKVWNVTGCKGDPGDQGVIIVTPCVKGGFLISCGKWMYVYMYMKNMPNANVTSQKKDPGPQGHWNFTLKDAQSRTFVLSTHKWPTWYMCMQVNGNVSGCLGDPGSQGYFTLHFD